MVRTFSIVAVLLLAAVLVWGQCAGCMQVGDTHDCCHKQQSETTSCHDPKPSQPERCECADLQTLLNSAKPEPGKAVVAALIPLADAPVPFLAPVPSPLLRSHPVDETSPPGQPEVHLRLRVLLI